MVETQTVDIPLEELSALRGKVAAIDIAVQVAFAVIGRDDSRRRDLQKIMEYLQDGRLSPTSSESGESFHKAFNEALRQYGKFADA